MNNILLTIITEYRKMVGEQYSDELYLRRRAIARSSVKSVLAGPGGITIDRGDERSIAIACDEADRNLLFRRLVSAINDPEVETFRWTPEWDNALHRAGVAR